MVKDLKWLKSPTYVNITKSALDFSDAIIIASENINPEIEEYARSLKNRCLNTNRKKITLMLTMSFTIHICAKMKKIMTLKIYVLLLVICSVSIISCKKYRNG